MQEINLLRRKQNSQSSFMKEESMNMVLQELEVKVIKSFLAEIQPQL